MKEVNEYIDLFYDGDAIEFMRELIEWCNGRPEFLNRQKSVVWLAKDFIYR